MFSEVQIQTLNIGIPYKHQQRIIRGRGRRLEQGSILFMQVGNYSYMEIRISGKSVSQYKLTEGFL
jgi:hypothetical protein